MGNLKPWTLNFKPVSQAHIAICIPVRLTFASLKQKRMKYLLIIFAAFTILSCGNSDQKSSVIASNGKDTGTNSLSQEVKDRAILDTVNFTTIKWIDSTFKDLGKVKEGQIVEVTYRFKNIGTKPLIFSMVNASCGCTVPEKPERPFAPGEEGTIKAKFDSSGRPKGQARKSIHIETNTDPIASDLIFNVEVTE